MNEQELQDIENRLQKLIDWKRSRERERLVIPLDTVSKNALSEWRTLNFDGLPLFTGKIVQAYNTFGTDFLSFGLEISINKDKRVVYVNYELNQYVVNAGSNTFTNSNGNHNLNNGDSVAFTTDGVIPSPLDYSVSYYIINRTASTFQVSTSVGGSAVDITDAGTGSQYWAKIS